MKIIQTTLSVVMLSTLFSVNSQAKELGKHRHPPKKIGIHDVYIFTGGTNQRALSSNIDIFKTLAPNSILLQNNLSGYNHSMGKGSRSTNFGVLVGIQFGKGHFRKRATNGPVLRLGFNYNNAYMLSGYYFKDDRYRYDTLTSSLTGKQTYYDSVSSTRYYTRYNSEQLHFDASLIFRTNPRARWSLYGGLGTQLGKSINTTTSINYHKYYSIESKGLDYSSYYSFQNNNNDKNEEIKNKNLFSATAYLPMGLDFRLGKRKEFWRRLHLYTEMKPGITYTSIPEVGTFTTTSWQNNFGIRVNF